MHGDSLDLGRGNGDDESWLESRNILKVEPTGFANELNLAMKTKGGIKDDPPDFWPEQLSECSTFTCSGRC